MQTRRVCDYLFLGLGKTFVFFTSHALMELAVNSLKIIIDQVRAALAQALKLILKLLEILIRKVFEIDHARARALDSAEQLVELEVHRLGIAVLGVLDQKDHQECDD